MDLDLAYPVLVRIEELHKQECLHLVGMAAHEGLCLVSYVHNVVGTGNT